MPETIANDLVAQWGAVGLLVACLVGAVVVLWRRLIQREDELTKHLSESGERLSENTAAMVELTMFIRGGNGHR